MNHLWNYPLKTVKNLTTKRKLNSFVENLPSAMKDTEALGIEASAKLCTNNIVALTITIYYSKPK